MNKIIFILFFVFLITYLLFIENNDAFSGINTLLENNKLQIPAAVPSNKSILKKVKQYLHPIKEEFFIDFGCGTGSVLLFFHNNFKKLIGIEIDKKTYQIAIENTKKIKNIEIINTDILKYKFELKNTVLFIYEPLFSLDYKKAVSIYRTLFDNLSNIFSNNTLKIIYVTGIFRKDITSLFSKYNFKTKKIYQKGAILLHNDVYILQLN